MKNLIKNAKPFIVKHSPELLLGMGIAGVVATCIEIAATTHKVTRKIDEYKQTAKVDTLSKKDICKLAWKEYIIPTITLGGSITCLVCSNRISNKRQIALATAYTLSETALQTYQDKIKEMTTENKANDIKDSVAQEIVNKTYNGNNITIIGDGDSLFYEPITGRYFKTTWNKLLTAANKLNALALTDMSGTISLNDWFETIGLNPVEFGYERGWNIMNGVKNLIDISPSSSLTPDGTPCGSISYNVRPMDI